MLFSYFQKCQDFNVFIHDIIRNRLIIEIDKIKCIIMFFIDFIYGIYFQIEENVICESECNIDYQIYKLSMFSQKH